jgi:eukaryotic-like serine/threonine-protein kinase
MGSDRVTSPTSVRFGENFEFNLRSFELKRAGQALKLERIPTDLLRLLIQNRGELVTRDQIVETVWGKDVFLDSDNSINAAIRKIRQVLEDDSAHPRYVQTLTGRGYRFIAAVEESGTDPAVEAPAPGNDADHKPGKRISHYRLIRLLGGGGMGLVYEGEDLKLGRRVAIKLLPTELASEPGAFERFEREARAASSLDHPNICSIYQLGEHDGQPFIVMQLLEGVTLREWIEAGVGRGSSQRLRELVGYAIQIADGLGAAHQKGIVHRDIKPANIFITQRGQAKILDFGVAKFVEQAEGTPTSGQDSVPAGDGPPTRTAASLGTPSYLSPEQIRREKLDTRTDLFSFGLVLYEMATSQRAFPGSTTTVIRDAVLDSPTVPVRDVMPDVPVELERIISKALVKDREQRWQTAREIADALQEVQGTLPTIVSGAQAETPPAEVKNARRHLKSALAVAALLLVIATTIFAALRYRDLRSSRLSDKDTVVLTDFSNNTGDSVFDDTLKQALKVSLSQSPFLRILPERTVRATLKLMTQPSNTPISPSIAREVCQRSGSKALISGAIASLDTEYVIGLKAENCVNGRMLAQEQVTARSKDDVIARLGEAATNLRSKLGESISTVKKFDVPLRMATTGSMEALKEYTIAGQAENQKGPLAAIPHYKRAISLDPMFARSYSALSAEYFDEGESSLAANYATKAYELRDRVTDLEKTQIDASYHSFATGDLEKAAHAYEQWAQITPWYPGPHSNLAYIYGQLGWNDKALSESLEGVRLGESGEAYTNVISAYIGIDRREEAKATFARALSRGLDVPSNHTSRYLIAFLDHDRAAMDEELAYAAKNHEVDAWMLYFESCTNSFYGRQARAREFTRRASAAASAQNQKEPAASYEAETALREALFGNAALARQAIQKVLRGSVGQDVKAVAALTYAFAGDNAKAQEIADSLAEQYPQNTIVQFNYLPSIRAQLALNAGHPETALENLKSARPYELGQPSQLMLLNMYPVYIHGQAYLAAHDNKSAIGEFQAILEHPGMSLNEPIAVLAHLGIARAHAAQGDKDRARSAYQDFLSIWREADPGLPLLKQARAEYARLQ